MWSNNISTWIIFNQNRIWSVDIPRIVFLAKRIFDQMSYTPAFNTINLIIICVYNIKTNNAHKCKEESFIWGLLCNLCEFYDWNYGLALLCCYLMLRFGPAQTCKLSNYCLHVFYFKNDQRTSRHCLYELLTQHIWFWTTVLHQWKC